METEKEFAMNAPAEAEGMQESASTVPSTQEKTEPSIREKMFGDKINKKENKNETDPKDPKQADKAEANNPANPEAAPNPSAKKDRIQQLAREKNKYKAELDAKNKELEQAKAELAKLHQNPNPTVKQQMREYFLEQKVDAGMKSIQTDLQTYKSKHTDPEMFETNYNYYMPILQKHDRWTEATIAKFPEKIEMFDRFFSAFTNGELDLRAWVNAPQPQKIAAINRLRKEVQNSKAVAASKPIMQGIPDSITPNFNPSHDPEIKGVGAVFKKVFERGRNKR